MATESIVLHLVIQDPIMLAITPQPAYAIAPVNVTPTLPIPPPAPLQQHPNDEAAIGAGLTVGDWYIFSADSDTGPHGVPKMVTEI